MSIWLDNGLWYCLIRCGKNRYMGHDQNRDKARQYAMELLCDAGEDWHDVD